jgi:hypothetical protein
MKFNRKILAAVVAPLILLGAACEEGSKSRQKEEKASEQALDQFLKSQPIPAFNWSQLRQNLIELQTAQANTTATTTFFFNQGVQEPITVCPSIGFPIPSTAQLTNPEQKVNNKDLTLPQLEATGIYTGESTGTYVICINDKGQAYAQYWEGFVSTVTGPATWDGVKIVLTGAPSAEFSAEQ